MDHLAPVIEIGGIPFDLAAIAMILITSVIVFVIARLAVRNLSVENPGKMQNFLEWLVEFVQGIIGTAMDYRKGRIYLTLGLALIMYIFIGNMLGLPLGIVTEVSASHPTIFGQELVVPAGGHHEGVLHVAWWKSPTADAMSTMALALTVIVLSHVQGLRVNRRHYLKHYLQPWWFFLPINIIEQLSKPLTLGLRLFGNIYAGEVMIAVILGMGVAGIPFLMVWQGFSIFVGTIQAFVFTMLTMVYIAQNTVHEEDH